MKPETKFSHTVVQRLRELGLFVQPIESHLTGVGIPDLFWQGMKTSGWIELKVLPVEFYGKIPPKMWRPGQPKWMYEICRRGGNAVTLIKHEGGFVVIKHGTLLRNGQELLRQEWEEFSSLEEAVHG